MADLKITVQILEGSSSEVCTVISSTNSQLSESLASTVN